MGPQTGWTEEEKKIIHEQGIYAFLKGRVVGEMDLKVLTKVTPISVTSYTVYQMMERLRTGFFIIRGMSTDIKAASLVKAITQLLRAEIVIIPAIEGSTDGRLYLNSSGVIDLARWLLCYPTAREELPDGLISTLLHNRYVYVNIYPEGGRKPT